MGDELKMKELAEGGAKRGKKISLLRAASAGIAMIILIFSLVTVVKSGIFSPRMSGGVAICLEESNRFIYFQNFADGSRIYRMNYDGKKLKKLTNESTNIFRTDGEDIVYRNYDKQNLTIMKMDGTKRRVLTNAGKISISDMEIQGNDIYYSGIDDSNPDGIAGAESGIFKTSKDNAEPVRLTDYSIRNFTIYKNKLYFVTYYEAGIYRMDLDGRNLEKLSDQETYQELSIAEDHVYYVLRTHDDGQRESLHKMSLDGSSDEIMISSMNFIDFEIYDNEIYFVGSTEEDDYAYDPGYGGRLYKKSMEGGKSELILEKSSHFWSFWVPLFILFCLSLRYCLRSGRSS